MILKQPEIKECRFCGKLIRGRADKKFCDDYCRATYNNELNSAGNNLVRNVNHALGKNRRILESLLPANETTRRTSRDKLLQLGFRFKYLTHTYTSQKKTLYYFCYEFGYLPLGNDCFLIVKRNED